MAAQMSNIDAVPVQVVTGKEWEALFLKRFTDERNVSAGGVVPHGGRSTQTAIVLKKKQ